MFRRKEDTLDADASYPVNLEQLGYFIDHSDEACIRNINDPDEFFDFHHTNNERHNEVRGEAMRTCQREEVLKRVAELGLKQLYLPALSYVKPNGPHVPILAPPADVLKKRKRVIVLINDDLFQDLGILAYRELQRESGINGGSIVNFLKQLVARSTNIDDGEDVTAGVSKQQIPSVIVLNTAQLHYSHKYNKAMTHRSWLALPRKSITHDAAVFHPVENSVEGHRTPQEHIQSILESVINNTDFVAPNAEIYVVAIENGAGNLVHVLNEKFWTHSSRITALALVHCEGANDLQIMHPGLKAFLHMRSRHWLAGDGGLTGPGCHTTCTGIPKDWKPQSYSQRKADGKFNWFEHATSPVEDDFHPSKRAVKNYTMSTYFEKPYSEDAREKAAHEFFIAQGPICPTFPGGEALVGECIFTQEGVRDTILRFFEQVATDPTNYSNPTFPAALTSAASSGEPHATFGPEAVQDENLGVFLTAAEARLRIKTKAAEVAEMELGLRDWPSELITARQRIENLISEKQGEIAALETALASNDVREAEVADLVDAGEEWGSQSNGNGERWVPPRTGQAVPFAGTQADSEVVREASGLAEVDEELARLGI